MTGNEILAKIEQVIADIKAQPPQPFIALNMHPILFKRLVKHCLKNRQLKRQWREARRTGKHASKREWLVGMGYPMWALEVSEDVVKDDRDSWRKRVCGLGANNACNASGKVYDCLCRD